MPSIPPAPGRLGDDGDDRWIAEPLPLGIRVILALLFVVVILFLALGLYTYLFGGPLKPFYCEFAAGEIARNGACVH